MGNGIANQSTADVVQARTDNNDVFKTSSEARGAGGSNPSLRTNIFSATHAPEHVTRHMCRVVGVAPHHRVLEPSAGSGGMVAVIHEFTLDVVANEINADLHRELQKGCLTTYRRDFLSIEPNEPFTIRGARQREVTLGYFDRIIMCPPARSDEHIRHAVKFLRPGGKLIALVQEQNIDLGLWPTYHRVKESFAHSGVTLPCGIITLQRRIRCSAATQIKH